LPAPAGSLAGASLTVPIGWSRRPRISGAVVLRRLRFGKLQNDQAEPLQNRTLDRAEGGRLVRYPHGARHYRGAQWDIELAPERTATG